MAINHHSFALPLRSQPEAEVIDEIVQDIINKLGHKFSAFADDLIGMAPRAEAVENLLDLDSEDVVRVVGIHGMGGIGKTTLAAVVYDRISHRFGACCFLQDRLPNLKFMNLRGSKNLIKTPNFGEMKNLEKIDLEGCSGLLQVDSSIEVLTKLTFINLRNCENLISIPKCLFLMSSLETLNLAGCSRLARRLNFEGPR
ncbi:TMV resistance protein N isoform X1 [Senna tora]|uniref:TMV resistance protein N isoform X1 n=1 Tax=Senna tora TaxID=362788 RepID=A0A834WN33_9FABA|nr:TMV resistance protein N isoform X1 [Senna tora]